MKELLLNVGPDQGQESRIAVAVSLAKSLGGHISCLQSVALPISVGDPAVVPPDVVEVLEKGAAELQEPSLLGGRSPSWKTVAPRSRGSTTITN